MLLSIERLLNLACLYIGTVEENYTLPRSFPPHGSCFHGYPIQLHINCESNKSEFISTCHSNESMSSIRQKIAAKLTSNIDHVQIYKADKLVSWFILFKGLLSPKMIFFYSGHYFKNSFPC